MKNMVRSLDESPRLSGWTYFHAAPFAMRMQPLRSVGKTSIHQFKLFGSSLYRIHDTHRSLPSLPDASRGTPLPRQQAATLFSRISSGA